MYIGTFDSFRFTAGSAAPVDSIITAGELIGVTKANVAAGEVGLAFMGIPAVVFELPIDALGANKSVGTAVYIDADGDLTFDSNDGSSPATAYNKFGILWKAAASGDTAIQVALR